MSKAEVSVESSLIPRASEATVADYIALMKPTVMSLAVFTAAVGMAVAPEGRIRCWRSRRSILIAMGAGAAGALNMWYDADIDGLMQRTAKRPIPRGLIPREEAAAFGVFLAAFSVLSLGLLVNWVAASLLAASIGFYLVVYTHWLKRRTPQNIVIGGAAGALPPMIGWAAASPGVSWEGFALFLIVFLWTPPHFWALALDPVARLCARGRADDAERARRRIARASKSSSTRRRRRFRDCFRVALGFAGGLRGRRPRALERGFRVLRMEGFPHPRRLRGRQGVAAALRLFDPLSLRAVRRSLGGSWIWTRTIKCFASGGRKRGKQSPRLRFSTRRRSVGKGCARSR